MNLKDALQKFRSQRAGAALRGIEWRLTFEEWLAWWGDDLVNRGRERHELSMQRLCDSGAYELGNIRKGTPKVNGVTRSAMYQTALAARIAQETIAALPDAAEPDEEEDPLAELELGYASMWQHHG